MVDLSPFWGFLVATSVGALLSGLTLWAARRSGIGTLQATMMTTMVENADQLERRVGILERALAAEEQTTTALRLRVDELTRTVVDLSNENTRLREQIAGKRL